jgi:phage terminase large subunit GpA-like protein
MVREYVKTRARNEALDCEVYALAALYSLPGMVRAWASWQKKPTRTNEPIQKDIAPEVDGWMAGRIRTRKHCEADPEDRCSCT